MSSGAYDDVPLLEMFREEVAMCTAELTRGLLQMENTAPTPEILKELMRHAHSLKGAAAVVERTPAVHLAHAMEDCFTAAQRGEATLSPARVDVLLRTVDFLNRLASVAEEEFEGWLTTQQRELDLLLMGLTAEAPLPPELSAPPCPPAPAPAAPAFPVASPTPSAPPPVSAAPTAPATPAGSALRVSAENLNRLLGLAGETVVASRWVRAFSAELLRLKREQAALAGALHRWRDHLPPGAVEERTSSFLAEAESRLGESRALLSTCLEDFGNFDRRFFVHSRRLYQEVLDCRMRPFSDGLASFPRLVRDAARSLGKEARLEIQGAETPVDREILERIEAPLGHLLRNAVDHGLEMPEARRAAGKPAAGTIRLEARHSSGMLLVEVAEDGAGLDAPALRAAVVRKGLTTTEVAEALSEAELFEFLFLPGFTMKSTVTALSGRGVGLDAVQTVAREVGGSVRVTSERGAGTRFTLQLPLTLSVLRTLVVQVDGEPFAFPLTRLHSALKVPRAHIISTEGRQHFHHGEAAIGLLTAHQVLGRAEMERSEEDLSVVLLGEKNERFGVVVDRFLGERELVVRPLDPRLGKIRNLAAAALLPDQRPVLIIDTDDFLRSVEVVVSGGRLTSLSGGPAAAQSRDRKRVLVVEDSLTVRELERKLIESRGYQVEVAVDGMDGWNAVRAGRYDAVVSDIDMPRLDGIELVHLIRKDPRLQGLPVMIVSYKDRPEDRRRGLEAGADYYLTKGSFHDETLLNVLRDLIGEAQE